MSLVVRNSQPSSAAVHLMAVVGAWVAVGQLVVVLISAVGWFLISPSLTDEQIAAGEDRFQLSSVTAFAVDVWRYVAVIILIGVLVVCVSRFHDRIHRRVVWLLCAALALVIPAQLTVLDSVFT